MQWVISRYSQFCFKFCIEVGFHAKNEFLVIFLRFIECRCHGNHMLFWPQIAVFSPRKYYFFAIFHTTFKDNMSFATLRWFGLVLYEVLPFKNDKNFDVIVSHKIGSLVITVVIFHKWQKWSFFKQIEHFQANIRSLSQTDFLTKMMWGERCIVDTYSNMNSNFHKWTLP